MVKVEGLNEREKSLRDKGSKLVKITEEALGATGKSRIVKDALDIGIFYLRHHGEGKDYSITVNADSNRVSVSHSAYLQEAISLAEMYEAFTKEEFTVKKEYA